MSLFASADTDAVRAAVDYARSKGKLIFAAVGEFLIDAPLVAYPAATPGVVGVSAVDKDLTALKKSAAGLAVDLSAPGEDIISACAGRTGLCRSKGTAVATALASTSAALIWSMHPDWTNNQVLRVMLNTAGGPTSGAQRNDNVGYGAVRPRIALKTPGDPGPADEYPLRDLAAAESPAPSAKPSKATGSSENSDDDSATATPAADGDGGSSAGLWIGLGVGAAVLVGAGVAVVAVRSRRRNAAAAPSAAPYPPQYPAQAPPAYQQQPQAQPPYAGYTPSQSQPDPNTPYGGAPGQGPRA